MGWEWARLTQVVLYLGDNAVKEIRPWSDKLFIFLPLLPTTVFLLLSAACYARSSERFYHRLVTGRWLGPYINNYRVRRGMTRRQKAITLTVLWLGIGTTMAWTATEWWMRLGLLAIASGVTAHVARLKRYVPEIQPMAATVR